MHNVAFVLLRRIRSPLIVLICVYAIAMLGFVLIPGMDDEGQPWKMDFFHAFYFVSFMGSTIGFGEIPYPFTSGQRMWATVTIYSSVVAWLYAIGSLLAVVQDPAFRTLSRQNAFRRSISRINSPFYLICGYGETSSLLIRALTEAGIRSVVIDADQNKLNTLELEDYPIPVPGLCADVSLPEILILGGLKQKNCIGCVALTDQDPINLKVALTSKLLNPSIKVIARAETQDAELNIASFGTDEIINPFTTFAGRLALALHSPSMFVLFEWMTGVPHEPLCKPIYPPRGTWILCGYGRFGKAVHERLKAEGVSATIIEEKPELTAAPEGTVVGRGTEAATLLEADICNAVGIVAGTDDDSNNLSIIMTARELNPHLFMVARKNHRANASVFQAAKTNLTMQRGSVIAHKIFALITTPLLAEFLRLAITHNNAWAESILKRVSAIAEDEAPQIWTVNINNEDAPALIDAFSKNQRPRLKQLYAHPKNRDETLPIFTLLLKRNNDEMLLPDGDTPLKAGDQILLCGQHDIRNQMEWVLKNRNVFHYIHTGEVLAQGWLWRKFMGSKSGHKK
ncbi:MAG: NAD-binding protein [Thiotrichaceae bacterium]|nr:NAD-binding protein [Thiotrichaceae bacterium]PCI12567.1 MAG: potassium transporter TrkA [Thiotrichales bacterium]